MDEKGALHLLQTLIDYFEAGNQETDAAAKAIIASDFDYGDKWQGEIKELLAEADWTGLRAPEAEIVTMGLLRLQKMVGER